MSENLGKSFSPIERRDYSIRAVFRVCDILDALRNAPGGVSAAELEVAAGLPKSSAFRYLSTLEQRNYVERHPGSGLYGLGSSFVSLDSQGIGALASDARSLMEELRDTTGETVHLGVLAGREGSYVEVVESVNRRRVAAAPGDSFPLHSTSLGKALLARIAADGGTLPLPQELPEFTPYTITDPVDLLAEIGRIRGRGYAVDDRESDVGCRCVAVAFDWGQMKVALSVSAPEDRVPPNRVAEVAAQVSRAATAIARRGTDHDLTAV